MKLHRSRSREEGHTLIEIAVVLSISLLIMQGVFNVMFHWERLFTEQVKHFTLDQSAERILHRLAEEIRAADPTTILPIVVSNSSTIQFQRVTGFAGGVATLGPAVTFGFALAPGETANGLDQNGNGLADEGYITMTEGLSTIRLAGNVMGLRFTSTGTGVTISTDIGMVDTKQNVTVKTFTQDVAFRNS